MHASDFADAFPGRLVRTPFGCDAFVPDNLPRAFPIDREIGVAEEKALLGLGALSTISHALPNHPLLISSPYLRREAVLSSKIEGTRTRVEQLFLFEEDEAAGTSHPTGGARGDAKEVYNYLTALQSGLAEIASKPVSGALLRALNATLLKDVSENDASKIGRFREVQAFIGSRDIRSARFVAPPPIFIDELIQDLDTFIGEPLAIPTLTKIAMIHYQFEAIHPFADGNGRIGRLLITLLLASYGLLPEPLLYLSAYFDRQKDEYVNRLWEISAKGAWKSWILFFLEGVREQAADGLQRAHRILGLRERYRTDLQRSKGGSAKLLELIDYLFYRPMITIPRAERVLKMTYEGARKNIGKLEKMGLLREVTGYSRNRIFLADEIIRLLD